MAIDGRGEIWRDKGAGVLKPICHRGAVSSGGLRWGVLLKDVISRFTSRSAAEVQTPGLNFRNRGKYLTSVGHAPLPVHEMAVGEVSFWGLDPQE